MNSLSSPSYHVAPSSSEKSIGLVPLQVMTPVSLTSERFTIVKYGGSTSVWMMTSGLFASSVGQFPVLYHVPSRDSGITQVSAETPLKALTLLRVGTLEQLLKSMTFIEELF